MRRPLRIAYFAEHFLPESGALPARVSEMAREWTAHGAQVTVICAMPHRPEGRIRPEYRGRLFSDTREGGVRVLRSWVWASPAHSFGGTILNNLSHAIVSLLQTSVSGVAADVIIASEPPLMPHIVGTMVGAAKGVPVVLEIRDLWPDYLAEMGIAPAPVVSALLGLERKLLSSASHVVTVTESFKRRIIAKGVVADRASVVSNGIDPEFYRPMADARHESVTRQAGAIVVGYLGNFGRGQGLEQVVDAARALAVNRPDVRFVLVGDGPTRASIASRISETGVRNVALRAPIPKSETPAFYNACDVLLVPHAPLKVFTETVPSKLFEVMACGRPFVASVAGEAAAIVRACGGGAVAEPGNPGALADAIAAQLGLAAAARQAQGDAMRRFVVEHYSRSALALRYLDILESVAARG